jgi:hypothetical protein
MLLTKEATGLAREGVALAFACEGCPPLTELTARQAKAGGRYRACPISFDVAFWRGPSSGAAPACHLDRIGSDVA